MNSFELSKRLTDSWFRLAGALEMMEGINVQRKQMNHCHICAINLMTTKTESIVAVGAIILGPCVSIERECPEG